MNVVLLPGNSRSNQVWIRDVERTLAPLFGRTLVHEYAHWQTGESFIDFDAELRALAAETGAFGKPYCIFAKSVGSVLALKGMHDGVLAAAKCLVVGLPLGLIEKQSLPVGKWLQDIKTPVLIGQNQGDPVGSFDAVGDFLAGFAGSKSCSLVKLPGNDHSYGELDELAKLAKSFLV